MAGAECDGQSRVVSACCASSRPGRLAADGMCGRDAVAELPGEVASRGEAGSGVAEERGRSDVWQQTCMCSVYEDFFQAGIVMAVPVAAAGAPGVMPIDFVHQVWVWLENVRCQHRSSPMLISNQNTQFERFKITDSGVNHESSSQLYLDGGSDRFDASDDWKACSILGTSTPSGNPLIDTLTMPSTVFPLGSVVFGAGDALISPLS